MFLKKSLSLVFNKTIRVHIEAAVFDKYKSNTTRIPLSVEINAHVFKNDLSRKMKDLRLIPTVRQISRSYKHKSHY